MHITTNISYQGSNYRVTVEGTGSPSRAKHHEELIQTIALESFKRISMYYSAPINRLEIDSPGVNALQRKAQILVNGRSLKQSPRQIAVSSQFFNLHKFSLKKPNKNNLGKNSSFAYFTLLSLLQILQARVFQTKAWIRSDITRL